MTRRSSKPFLSLIDSSNVSHLDRIASTDDLPVAIAHLVGSGSADLIIGSVSGERIEGLAGDDYLKGRGGDDVLDGGTGADHMRGGSGDDIYFVDDSGDVVDELSAADGTDLVRSLVSFALPIYVENLTLAGTAAIDGTGNASANILKGNGAANLLDGDGGADEMRGGAGDDIYVVNDAGDKVIELAAGDGLDTVRSNVSYALPSYVENLVLTGRAAIDGSGNALDNHIVGNSLDNILSGGAGDDTLIAHGGDDELQGDSGNDSLDGGRGNDRLSGGKGNDILDGGDGDDRIVRHRACWELAERVERFGFAQLNPWKRWWTHQGSNLGPADKEFATQPIKSVT